MKKLLWILLIAGVALTAKADVTSFVELSAKGGWSTLGYRAEAVQQLTFDNVGSYGYGAHIGYGMYFNRMVGLSVGADFSRYGSTLRGKGTITYTGVNSIYPAAPAPADLYNHTVTVNALRDAQEICYVEIPLALCLRFPLGAVNIHVQAGAKCGFAVMSGAEAASDTEHSGYFPEGHLAIRPDVPGHGFYRQPDAQYRYDMEVNSLQVVGFVKLGIGYPMQRNPHCEWFANIYAGYGFLNAVKMPENKTELGFLNDRPGQENNHYFMTPYTGIFTTNSISPDSSPAEVGLEIGFRYLIPHTRTYPCRCVCD